MAQCKRVCCRAGIVPEVQDNCIGIERDVILYCIQELAMLRAGCPCIHNKDDALIDLRLSSAGHLQKGEQKNDTNTTHSEFLGNAFMACTQLCCQCTGTTPVPGRQCFIKKLV